MAQLVQAFDSGQHDDMNNFDPIPPGAYIAQITGSQIKDTARKDGQYISFEFTVLKGEFKGRKIWTNLNIVNPSAMAVEIAQKELATICRACGKAVIQDTQQLHGIPFEMKVRIVPAKGDYPPKNAPTGYAPLAGADAPKNGDFESNDAKSQSDDAPWQNDIDDDIPF